MVKHEHKGRTWWLRRREPYIRRDGTATELLVWETLCAECLAPFEVTTPSEGAWGASKAFGVKHCKAHKLTRSQCRQRAKAASKARKLANREKAARNMVQREACNVQISACNVQHEVQRCATLGRQSGVLQHEREDAVGGPLVLHRCSRLGVATAGDDSAEPWTLQKTAGTPPAGGLQNFAGSAP